MTSSNDKKTAKELVRDENGKFLKGKSGNPAGRPKGAKNRVTLMQAALQEGWIEGNHAKIQEILNSVVEDAINGDKSARKMVWEANIAKPTLKEEAVDKDAAPQITIRHMEVSKQGDIIDVNVIEEEEDEQ